MQLADEALFDSQVAIAEQRYDIIINSLIEKCDAAIKSKDWRLVKRLDGVVTGWVGYFEAQKAFIAKAFDDADPTKEPVLLFIGDQIKFLKCLHKELLR